MEKHAEVERSRGLAGLIGTPVGALRRLCPLGLRGLVRSGSLLHQESQVRGGLRMAPRAAPPPGGFGAVEVAGLVQQDAEVEARVAVASALGAFVSLAGASEMAALVEEHAEVERVGGLLAGGGGTIRPLQRRDLGLGPSCGSHRQLNLVARRRDPLPEGRAPPELRSSTPVGPWPRSSPPRS